jgi:hypothetical protein
MVDNLKTSGGGNMKAPISVGLIILLAFATVIGCGGKNTVDLRYKPAGINVAPCAKAISVVELEDKREQTAVGETKDGDLFFGKTSVTEWVSKALYDELAKSGCRVEFHEKEYDFDTDYTLIGEIEELFVKQNSLTDYSASMRLKLNVKADGQKVFGKSFATTYSKTAVVSPGVNSKVLTELLQGLMREVVPEIRDNLK